MATPTDLTTLVGTPLKTFLCQNLTQGSAQTSGRVRAQVGDVMQVNAPVPLALGLALTIIGTDPSGKQTSLPVPIGAAALSTLVGTFTTTMPGSFDFTAPGYTILTVVFS